jgi:hypothetical protein
MIPAVSAQALKAATETYAMESLLAGTDQGAAMMAALAAGIRVESQRLRSQIADEAETCARELADEAPEDEDEGTPEFAVALAWFADRLRKHAPEADPSEQYEPQKGDVVEVSIVGEVNTTGTLEGGIASWSVLDDYTGLAFSWPAYDGIEPKVRVLSRAGERTVIDGTTEGQ